MIGKQLVEAFEQQSSNPIIHHLNLNLVARRGNAPRSAD